MYSYLFIFNAFQNATQQYKNFYKHWISPFIYVNKPSGVSKKRKPLWNSIRSNAVYKQNKTIKNKPNGFYVKMLGKTCHSSTQVYIILSFQLVNKQYNKDSKSIYFVLSTQRFDVVFPDPFIKITKVYCFIVYAIICRKCEFKHKFCRKVWEDSDIGILNNKSWNKCLLQVFLLLFRTLKVLKTSSFNHRGFKNWSYTLT